LVSGKDGKDTSPVCPKGCSGIHQEGIPDQRAQYGKHKEGSKFHFEPDPYPKQNLFYRSDNATLAALGVPAHTISTSKMEEAPNNEPNYHKQSDEIGTLDMNNMAEIIKAIALSSKTIVSGKDTPTRVVKEK